MKQKERYKERTSISVEPVTKQILEKAQNHHNINVSRWINKIIKNVLSEPIVVKKLEAKEALDEFNKKMEELRELEKEEFTPTIIEGVSEAKETSLYEFIDKIPKDKKTRQRI